jgi:hypothetical protein
LGLFILSISASGVVGASPKFTIASDALYKGDMTIGTHSFGMALHIINAIYNNPYNTEYYRYDYSMGRLETPTPIVDKDDIEDLIFFDDEE